ncbi:MAG: cobalamin-binding protein [Promethearchaeota archaeon]|nr:MAG: cobalamin-binding protein [Candidatus Lokiarchaeota archaeon]
MHPLYEEFLEYIDKEDKEQCVRFVLDKLDKNEIDVPTLYKEILEPSLNRFYCDADEQKLCIWKEHVRTSIIRTIIELCYPYILKEREQRGARILDQKVLVGCPSEEYHDTGARMVADIFSLFGFDAIFVGANTPREEIRDAINILKPKYIAMCITNYFTFVEAEKAISLIKTHTDFDGKIIVGGSAFLSNPDAYKKIGADLLIQDFKDIEKLAQEA